MNMELWFLDDTNNSVTREHEVKLKKILQLIGDDKLSIYYTIDLNRFQTLTEKLYNKAWH